jgi:hypothetical protein
MNEQINTPAAEQHPLACAPKTPGSKSQHVKSSGRFAVVSRTCGLDGTDYSGRDRFPYHSQAPKK